MQTTQAVAAENMHSVPQHIADTLQDILKSNPVLHSVTVAFNWQPSTNEQAPPGVIVTSAGEVGNLDGKEVVAMLNQWLLLYTQLTRMLAAATAREQMKVIDAATTLRHIEVLHDKARTTENVTTPFREILRIATTEGLGNAISQFEQWFCSIRGGTKEGNKAEEEEEAEV